MSVAAQQRLSSGEELHDPREPRHRRHVRGTSNPAAALTQRQRGLHPRRVGRSRARHGIQVARWVTVTSAVKADVWRIGKVRRAYWTCAGPRQDRMSAWALWVSAMAATAAHVRANLPFRAPRWAPTGDE